MRRLGRAAYGGEGKGGKGRCAASTGVQVRSGCRGHAHLRGMVNSPPCGGRTGEEVFERQNSSDTTTYASTLTISAISGP
jgi:hypothetical protein